MQNVEKQKLRLEQKKARVAIEETRLKIKERKMRTRYLIEKGGLITKANLDYLPTNALYGALLSLKNSLNDNSDIVSSWVKIGNTAFDNEAKTSKAIILKFSDIPSADIREFIRLNGLKYNRFRSEWYGNVKDIDELKTKLQSIEFEIEEI